MPVIKEFKLTKREVVVLKLISMGCSNRQIAARLFISEQTVKKHMRNIFTKLEVSNRVAALRRSGLL